MIFRPKVFILPLLTALFLLMDWRGASALETSTTGEDVAIAYFKTANIKPDFDKWARGSEAFKSIAPARVPEFVEKEKQRLLKKWNERGADGFIFEINAPVSIELKTVTDEKGQEKYLMEIAFEEGKVDYFPYAFQDYNFAVIPHGMETMLVQELPKSQFDLLFQEFVETAAGPAILRIQLKPSKSYTGQPYEMDGVEQWILLTDIATMALASVKNEAQLWNYGAGWYVSPDTKAVQDLYKGGAQAAPAQ